MKTVLLTGAAGFIGSHLSEKLLNLGCKVVALDNFDPFYPAIYKRANINNLLKFKRFIFIETDIRKINHIKNIIKKYQPIDCLIHLAARAGVRSSINKPLVYQKINIEGTYNLLFLSGRFKVKQFIFASSSSVYGNAPVPFSENEINLSPLSPYGVTKLAGEQACYIFHKLYKLPVTILRFFSVYGPKGRPDMAPYLFTKNIFSNNVIKQYGDGSSSRDWTYIDDIVNGIVLATKNLFPFEIINLGGNKSISLNKLILTIEKYTHKKFKKSILPFRSDEPKNTYADIRKANQLLKWESRDSFEIGMKKFIQWFISERLKK